MKLQLFLRKYSTPAMWAAGGLTLLGILSAKSAPGIGNTLFLAAMVLAGTPIVIRAVQGLKYKAVGIEVLVSIAVIGACIIGEFSEAAIVTFLFQFGSWLEQKTMKKTRSAIKALTELAPRTAWRIQDGDIAEIDADEVEEGDILLLKTGNQIAADGLIIEGEGYVTEASITGEAQAKHKEVGAAVYSGSFVDSGTLKMQASRVGEEALFSGEVTNRFGEALTAVEACFFRREDFLKLLTDYPSISIRLLEEYSRRLLHANQQAAANLRENVMQRLAGYLLELASAEESNRFTLPLPMKELSVFLSTTPETLSRRIKQLEAEGILAKKGRRITLLQEDALRGILN